MKRLGDNWPAWHSRYWPAKRDPAMKPLVERMRRDARKVAHGLAEVDEFDEGFVLLPARDARPGNWLPSGRSGRIVLVLTVQDAAFAATVHDGGAAKLLPEVQRVACR